MTLRLTPAGYLAILTILGLIVCIVAYVVNMPLVYIAALPMTACAFLVTGDMVSRHVSR